MKRNLFCLLLISGVLCACGNAIEKDTPVSDEDTLTADVAAGPAYQPIEFESTDSLLISANLYEIDPAKPIMVLCHQANFNKYEYAGIAERLNDLGFNCLAIDQRSGGPIADQVNETHQRAIEQKKPTEYLDAEKDIVAAINYAYDKYQQQVILVGSSYSSTLAVYQATENEKVSAVIAFSPGNYFAPDRGDLMEKLMTFEKPFFFTAARDEIPFVREILLGRPRDNNMQVLFVPEGEGWHGARALWPTQDGGEEYWLALEEFLEKLKKASL
jgi:pimeloyl-ACP methyl ester carboxylesterase